MEREAYPLFLRSAHAAGEDVVGWAESMLKALVGRISTRKEAPGRPGQVPRLSAAATDRGEDASPDPRARPRGLGALSLRTKGIIVFLAFAVYATGFGIFLLYQKHILLNQFDELRAIAQTGDMVVRFEADLFRVATMATSPEDPAFIVPQVSDARSQLATLWNQYAKLGASAPEVPLALTRLDAQLAQLAAHPSPSATAQFRVEILREHESLRNLARELHRHEYALSQQYKHHANGVAEMAVLLGIDGIIFFGTIGTIFFARLTHDVLRMKDHATKLIESDFREPIAVTRGDEVGNLMEAFNFLSRGLKERERQLHVERHKYYHREKMAAIGDLAAGIAHEIGNPISAIAGIAQSMQEIPLSGPCADGEDPCPSAMILAQTARLAAIAREISGFATPAPAEHQLIDLNELLRSTCRFVRYDRRFRTINLDMNLNHQLPAVNAIGDRLTQVVMNLLFNAADALEDMQDRAPTIRITTSASGSEVCLAVADNGCGMDQNTLDHAFEAFFTTKRPGRGTGLGLALCYSIIAEHGGRIELDSTPNKGTCVRVLLPQEPPADRARERAS